MKTVNVLLALMSFLAVTLVSAASLACKQNTLQCGGGSPGGAVFICENGAWVVLVNCRTSESCYKDPVPHCSSARTGTETIGTAAVPGFENSPAEISAAAFANNKDTREETPEAVDTGNDDATSLYYNHCKPCIRHNDDCKKSCARQGKDCDASCNSKTCSVSLPTGDIRQPSVSCGQFCKWPCH